MAYRPIRKDFNGIDHIRMKSFFFDFFSRFHSFNSRTEELKRKIIFQDIHSPTYPPYAIDRKPEIYSVTNEAHAKNTESTRNSCAMTCTNSHQTEQGFDIENLKIKCLEFITVSAVVALSLFLSLFLTLSFSLWLGRHSSSLRQIRKKRRPK